MRRRSRHRHRLKRNSASRLMRTSESGPHCPKWTMVADEPGQYNAVELAAFCRVMRFTGLRISDVTMLHEKQIVKRHGGEGWAIEAFQIKTNEWVRVPVPFSLVEQLRALQVKGRCAGKSYWFWSCNGELKTAITNWRDRVTRLLKLAQKAGQFEHSSSPYTFRHTFAISHLNAGVDIKVVSRWLGHRSITTTEKHYSHAIRETHVTAERLYDESLKATRDRVITRSYTLTGTR